MEKKNKTTPGARITNIISAKIRTPNYLEEPDEESG